jgi:predicted PurR-regulated permease PerM
MTPHQPVQAQQWTFRRVMAATLIVATLALGFWLLYRFHQAVFVLWIAIVIGTALGPLVAWLHRRGLPRTAAIMLVYSLLLALFVGFALLILPLVVEQGATIAADVPEYYLALREWVSRYPSQLTERLGEFMPATLPGLEQTEQQTLALAGQAAGLLASSAKIIYLTTVTLLLAFHWMLDGPRAIQSWLLLMPGDKRESMGQLIAAMSSKIGSYIAGQSVLCLVIGGMALVTYLLIGLPNALVLALVAGVAEAVPLVGPLLGAIPAGVIALSIAPSKLIWVVIATVVIQQLENAVLVPRVMRKAVGVNPFVSLLAIFALSSLFGIAGALMAIPLAATAQLLLDRFVFDLTANEQEASPSRDYASRLRYEAQDLAQDLRKQARLKKEGSDLRVQQIDRVMDEIEALATDLDALLSQPPATGAP